MPEHTLEELRKLAIPALRHAELVEIARTKRPNEARYIAHNAGWPRRQVRAVKFLAMLVRDYGSGALEALITSMEQVRAVDCTAPEQAREKEKMIDRIRERLKLITDPAHKLSLMIEHNLHDDASAFIEELARTSSMFAFSHHCWGKSSPTIVKTPADNNSDLKLAFGDGTEPWFSFSFEGMAKTLGWSEETKHRIAQSALSGLLKPAPHLWTSEVSAGLYAERQYLSSDDPLAKKIELLYLRYHMQAGDVFDLRRSLPIKMEPASDARHELDPIVDRFVELGVSSEEVRSLFLQWLRHLGGRYNPSIDIAVAGAKCFKDDDPERNAIMWEQCILPQWSYFVQHGGARRLRELHALLSLLHWENRRSHCQFFHFELVTLIRKGELSRAFQIALTLGDDLGVLWPVNTEDELLKKAKEFVTSLVPYAFLQAFDRGDYGIAAALVQHFGEEGCYSEKCLEQVVDQQFKDRFAAVASEYADMEKAWSDGESEEFFDDGRGKEWQDALSVLSEEKDKVLEELKQKRKHQVGEVTQIAIDLKKPIRLEIFAYCMAPEWPNS